MILTWENRNTRRKPCPSAVIIIIFSIPNRGLFNAFAARRDVTGRGHSERTSVAGRVHLLPGSISDDVREPESSTFMVVYVTGERALSLSRTQCHRLRASNCLFMTFVFLEGKLVHVHAMKALDGGQ
jgi:hypothetical protein